MTRPEEILRDALEDAEICFGILEATLRQCKQEPVADIVSKFKNKASAALSLAMSLSKLEEKLREENCSDRNRPDRDAGDRR
jgi:hypothetical protein